MAGHKKEISIEPLIRAENISYSYPIYEDEETDVTREGKAIDDVSLSIEPGQFVCILGRNGSGKSTFARHLNALLVPDAGTLWVNGMDSKDAQHILDIRKSVGMVFQNPDNQIVATIVEEDVAFGPENIGVPSEEIVSEVERSLERVNMSEYAKSSPNNLSGGQKQRVAVAGILAMHPECIVLDESTSMLDPRGRREIMEAVHALNKEQGITIICITHYMDEAMDADRIFVMDNARVILEGTPKEIFSQTEKIKQAGLMLPQICELAEVLRSEGLDIPEGIISEEELKTELIRLYKNR